ncbi:MAG: thioredoxin-dependent thiol peroxidase [Flavobacteriales bacterium]|nr:thioredoxin-dependent thiol peroxidase [Flavobacteriales bacterium]
MPERGQKAPSFVAKDQYGRVVRSKDMKGSRYMLYFYPKDDTPTCTVQACNLRDAAKPLSAAGVEVIGVSPDGIERHAKFSAKYELPFRLLEDPEHRIMNAYGVWGPKQLYGRKYEGVHRTTFLIDENGIIVDVITAVKSKAHADQVLKAFKHKSAVPKLARSTGKSGVVSGSKADDMKTRKHK